jgi:uncharacterized Fe-S cluster-containing MiaB family protein
VYPVRASERARWILERRPARNPLDPRWPYAFLHEEEPGPDAQPAPTATLFLTNRECPFRCLMCDLWQNTLEESVPPGAIPDQIRYALDRLPPSRAIKLYNAGSFFDPRAIPPDDLPEIARLCAPFERVIVECHPAFVGAACFRFRDLLLASRQALDAAPSPGGAAVFSQGCSAAEPLEASGRKRNRAPEGRQSLTLAPPAPRLEVAMGLETVHPEVLPRLNKRMTLAQFAAAASLLRREAIDLRVFVLVRPPWLTDAEGIEWACRSLDFAWECGATVCSLIPTRPGNGALDALAATGEFAPPSLRALEAALEYGLHARRGRVFADLWDIERFAGCSACAAQRIERIQEMNRRQEVLQPLDCSACARELP